MTGGSLSEHAALKRRVARGKKPEQTGWRNTHQITMPAIPGQLTKHTRHNDELGIFQTFHGQMSRAAGHAVLMQVMPCPWRTVP